MPKLALDEITFNWQKKIAVSCVTEAKLSLYVTVCSISAIGLVTRSSKLTTNFEIWGTSLFILFL